MSEQRKQRLCAKCWSTPVGDAPPFLCGNCRSVPVENAGGVKNDQGKPKLSLLTLESLIAEASALEYGAAKYGRDNYKLGMDWTRVIDASLRHIYAFAAGEDHDAESKLNHLNHAKACLAMLVFYYENGIGKDDRSNP